MHVARSEEAGRPDDVSAAAIVTEKPLYLIVEAELSRARRTHRGHCLREIAGAARVPRRLAKIDAQLTFTPRQHIQIDPLGPRDVNRNVGKSIDDERERRGHDEGHQRKCDGHLDIVQIGPMIYGISRAKQAPESRSSHCGDCHDPPR